MQFDALAYSSVGGRECNEDSALTKRLPDGLLAIVSDGLGGHARGDEASRLAVQAIAKGLDHASFSKDSLRDAIARANAKIFARQSAAPMRSTAAVLWLERGEALVGTVGDTRVYLLRDGSVAFQSTDHSLAQFDVMAGEITPQEIRGNARRNKLLRALGAADDVKPDITLISAQPGDIFLLCSDGCWELVEESEMIDELQRSDFVTWFSWLEATASRRGDNSADNHTAIAVRVAP